MKKSNKNNKKEIYFSTYVLKERGWKDSVIKKLLPEPDETFVNPRYKNAAPGKLFLKSRVYGKERTKIFKEFLLKTEKRSEAAKRAVETKMEKNINSLDKINIKIRKMNMNGITHNAINQYNNWNFDKPNFQYVDMNSDVNFLERISLNYIRHDLTTYDEILYNDLFGKVGKSVMYDLLNDKIDEEILKMYPDMIDTVKARQAYKYGNYHLKTA